MSTRFAAVEGVPDTWVPVERRWMGVDRRTIPPAIVSIVLIALFSLVLPALDRSIDHEREIEAGDVVNLGSGITFVPEVGWGLKDGLLVGHDTVSRVEEGSHLGATLVHGGVTFTVTTGAFTGTPDELLDRVQSLNEAFKRVDSGTHGSERVTATTDGGATGVAQSFTGVNVDGVITTFVIDGVGIEFVVSGPPGSLDVNTDAINDMIASLAADRPEVAR